MIGLTNISNPKGGLESGSKGCGLATASCLVLISVLVVTLVAGCASFSSLGNRELQPFRIRDVLAQGDPARRASLRLIDEGLEADAAGHRDRAMARYQRAIQVDATNPYVYLAIARHQIEARDPQTALQLLERADSMLELSGERSPEVVVHIVGMRGEALYDKGKIDAGVALLERARLLAPTVWGDGVLSSAELR